MQWLLGGSEFLPGSDVALTSARRYYNSEQPMQFLISTRNLDRAIYQPQLVISGNGKTTEVEPRAREESFVAEAGPFAPGTYTVTLKNNVGQPAELSQSIEVVSASVEKRELSVDPETMQQLAEISGGAVVTAKDVARLPEIVRRWNAARELSHRRHPAWDRWWVLAGIFALLGAGWFEWRRLSETRLARLFEQSDAALGNRLINAVQLADKSSASGTEELFRRQVIELGRQAARNFDTWPVVHRGLKRAGVFLGCVLVAWLALSALNSDLIQAVLPRLFDAHGDHPPYSRLRIDVKADKSRCGR